MRQHADVRRHPPVRGTPVPRIWIGVMLALVTAFPALAQVATGRIEVTVVDTTGAVLPGVFLDLTGPQNRTYTTGNDGIARFLNLPPGIYVVKASRAGFSDYENTSAAVVAGGAVQLKATMVLARLDQQVDVTAESPIIDASRTGASTTVTLDELQNIPSARDPWVVLQTVPGVVMDRVNVGGSESGQQSGYLAKGTAGGDATWNIDGMPITDMAATGATPVYYDFDALQELNVTTGGADMTSATGGVALNLILKSGTNTPRGSARAYFENEAMQGNNMSQELATALGSPNGLGNRVSRFRDAGVEVGLPIIKDRLWVWGSLGRTDVRVLTIGQTPDNTTLDNTALKVQAQVSQRVRAGFTYFRGNKVKHGRDAGATRPPETTYNQNGPSTLYKGDVNLVLGDRLYLTARGSSFPSGFRFDPQGGMDKDVWRDDGGVWHGSFDTYATDRPQQAAAAEGSYFRGKHEMKFGFLWRRVTARTTSLWSSSRGDGVVSYYIGYPEIYVTVVSPWEEAALAHYGSAWIGDTYSTDRVTINAGVRLDRQSDGVLSASEAAVPGFEAWLPAISAHAVPDAITWNSFSPRVGVTYALDEARKAQLRGSYAMFASQLANGASSVVSAVQYRYAAFYAVDRNGNKTADPGEIDTSVLAGWSGFNPANPAQPQTNNTIGGYRVPKTHEVVVGMDRELFRHVGVSVSLTWRKLVDFNWEPRIGVRKDDYALAGTVSGGGLPDGSSYKVPYYAVVTSGLSAAALSGGVEYTARDGYHQRFWGIDASATKRLSNRWMARVGFSTNDHREYFDNPATAIGDPTPGPGNANTNGGLVTVQSAGSGKSGVWQLLPKYQFIANGLYQAPHGVDLAFSVLSRQGFGQPWYRSAVSTGDYFDSLKDVLVIADIGTNRLPSVTTVDVRAGKSFKVSRSTIDFNLDIFNLFNSGTVLQRQYDIRLTGATGFNRPLEIMNPRIARIGVRVSF
jgi:hypothetical protein